MPRWPTICSRCAARNAFEEGGAAVVLAVFGESILSATNKLLILGASGFIGSRLMQAWPAGACVGTYLHRPMANGVRFDIATERLSQRLLLRGHGFTHAVLAQGVTKLDQCALSPELSNAANVRGPLNAIADLLDAGVHPIFLSSDAVFDGTTGPRSEAEEPCPILEYGRQKVAVEAYLRSQSSPWTILRLCKVVAGFTDERNMLAAWLGKVVRGEPILCATDQILTPVDLDDVVRAVTFFANTGTPGLFHVAGSQSITRHGLLLELLRHVPEEQRGRADIRTCRLEEICSPEPLPVNCGLQNDKLRAILNWEPVAMATVCGNLCRNVFFRAEAFNRLEDAIGVVRSRAL
jgi:dTDP-4-dehydrorhamnose reductase